jgi:hypothetical protein
MGLGQGGGEEETEGEEKGQEGADASHFYAFGRDFRSLNAKNRPQNPELGFVDGFRSRKFFGKNKKKRFFGGKTLTTAF